MNKLTNSVLSLGTAIALGTTGCSSGGSSTNASNDGNVTTPVEKINTAPEIKSGVVDITDSTKEGTEKVISISDNFSDPDGDTLSYDSNVTLPTGVTLDKVSGEMTFSPDVDTTNENIVIPTFGVYAIDGNNSVSSNLPVHLTAINVNNDSPLNSADIVADTNVTLGDDYNLSIEFSDDDGIDSAVYAVYANNDTDFLSPLTTGILEDSDNDGNYTTTIDTTSLGEGDFTVSVNIAGIDGGDNPEDAVSTTTKLHNFSVSVLDTTPDTFDFTDIVDAEVNSTVETNIVEIAGTNTTVTVTTDTGTIVIDSTDTLTTSATGELTNKVSYIIPTPSTYSTSILVTVTIGDTTDTFTVTTKDAINTAPTGENITVDAGYMNIASEDLNDNLSDINGNIPLTATKVGSGVLGGDPIISNAEIVGNIASLTVSSGIGQGYIDYQVDDGIDTNPTVYRITFNNLNGE